MLGSNTAVVLTLLLSGVSFALSNNDILPPGIDGTGGPRDLYAAAKLTASGAIERREELAELSEQAELKKLPEENPEFAGIYSLSSSQNLHSHSV